MMALQRFDPNLMIQEVQDMTETLYKIKAGALTAEEFVGFSAEVTN
jgi:hypothetical protein